MAERPLTLQRLLEPFDFRCRPGASSPTRPESLGRPRCLPRKGDIRADRPIRRRIRLSCARPTADCPSVSSDSSSAGPGSRDSEEGAPRLVLRFAAYTGIVLLAAGFAIFWTVDREVAGRAARAVETQARLVAEENLRRQLLKSDFSAPVHGARLAELDAILRGKS